MRKTSLWSLVIVCLCATICHAQELIPTIQLTPDEVAKAKQVTEELKSAQDRSRKAERAWYEFHSQYQKAHPELPNMRFSSDFKAAFALNNEYATAGLIQAIRVELTPTSAKTPKTCTRN